MNGWLCFAIGAVAGGCLGCVCMALMAASGHQSRVEEWERLLRELAAEEARGDGKD